MRHFIEKIHKLGIAEELVELTLRYAPEGTKSFDIVSRLAALECGDIILGIVPITATHSSMIFLEVDSACMIKFATWDEEIWPISVADWGKHWEKTLKEIKQRSE